MKSTFKLAIGDNESTKNQKGKAPTTKTSQTPAHGNTIPDSTPTSAMFEQLLQKIDQLKQPVKLLPCTNCITTVVPESVSSRNTNGDSASSSCQSASGAGWELGSGRIARWHGPVCATFVIVDV